MQAPTLTSRLGDASTDQLTSQAISALAAHYSNAGTNSTMTRMAIGISGLLLLYAVVMKGSRR